MCGEIRGVVVKSQCISVFIKPRSEATSSLSHISHIAVRTSVCTPQIASICQASVACASVVTG